MSDLSVSALIAAMIREGVIPATVEAKAQGIAVTVDVAAFAPESIGIAFTYGVRRMVQDHVNSAAHQFKSSDAEGEFDAQACIDARLAAFANGSLLTRGNTVTESFTREDNAIYDLVIGLRGNSAWGAIATAWTLSKGLSTTERKRAILAAFDTMPDAAKAKARAIVAEKLAAEDALAALSF